MHILIIEKLYNFGTHWIIGILLVLYITYLVLRNQNKFVFYINNYIGWYQFN